MKVGKGNELKLNEINNGDEPKLLKFAEVKFI